MEVATQLVAMTGHTVNELCLDQPGKVTQLTPHHPHPFWDQFWNGVGAPTACKGWRRSMMILISHRNHITLLWHTAEVTNTSSNHGRVGHGLKVYNNPLFKAHHYQLKYHVSYHSCRSQCDQKSKREVLDLDTGICHSVCVCVWGWGVGGGGGQDRCSV